MNDMKKVLVSCLALVLFSACARVQNSPQKKFGDDSNYFLALQASQEGNEKDAIRYFKAAQKNGSEIIKRRAAESLTLIGSVPKRIEAAENLAKNYDDENALLTACRELFSHNEFLKIINLTENLNPHDSKNELIKLRLLSLAQKKDGRFDEEFFRWFVARPLSSEHLETYATYIARLNEKNQNIQEESEKFQKNLNKRSLLESQLSLDEASSPSTQNDEGTPPQLSIAPEEGFEELFDALSQAENPEKSIMEFRIAVFHRAYKIALAQIEKIQKIYENRDEEIDSQIFSDIGKATLYATNDFFASARKFDKMAEKLPPEKAYFAHFYAARLYDKAGRYPKQTVSSFRSALEDTKDPLQFDNCLWYLLNFLLRSSTDEIISPLTNYGSKIHDSEYFDDFFESLSILLLSSHRWQDFYKVWKETNSNFSDYTAGKYAYISGRLIEEGLAKGDEDLKTRQTVEAFTKVLNGKSSLYYKVLALERLNVTDKSLIDSYLFNKNEEEDKIDDKGAGQLLKGYAAFGFPERIYGEWISNRKNISNSDTIEICDFLTKCAESNKESTYNVQSLRVASRAFEQTNGRIPEQLLKLNFPRFYKTEIEGACAEFGLPTYLVYAMIRSESFFDPTVTSKAGASGLTQLMEATAEDEAKKLKINDNFDIFDPLTNIRLGTHYLSSLVNRTDDNNELLALYAYNAGLTNVRNWIKRFRSDWAATGKASHKPAGISMDLFLESLPFAETREYGRKVVSAAALYAYLYDEKLPGDTVREIMY